MGTRSGGGGRARVAGRAKRIGLTLAALPNGGAASGGKYKYAIRGKGSGSHPVSMRAKNLKEANSLISGTIRENRKGGSIRKMGNSYQVYRQYSGGVQRLVAQPRTRAAAQRLIDKG
jgi:hypothetical protein